MAETDPTQTILLNRLAKTLDGEKASATFACGGTSSHRLLDNKNKDIIAPSSPILFYEDKNGDCHKVIFPASADEMSTLASHCDLASFGMGAEERLDIEYRSAWKLDNAQFATSFHPFDSDIMEVVKQLLFPGAVRLDPAQPIVVAELYKLNVNILNFIHLIGRFTKDLMTSSNLMLIPLDLNISSDLWLFVFHVRIQGDNLQFVMTDARSYSIGARTRILFNGQHFTAIVSMKYCLLHLAIELHLLTTFTTINMVVKSRVVPVGRMIHFPCIKCLQKSFKLNILCLMVPMTFFISLNM